MRRNNLFDQHTLDILKAAMPHVHPRAQSEMSVLLKANDLIDTISGQGSNDELSTMDLQNWKADPEELLVSIKDVLNEGETEIADMLLNFMKARRIYSAYQNYSDNILQAQSFGNNQSGNNGNRNSNSRRNPFGAMNNQRYRNQGNNNSMNANGGGSQNTAHKQASGVNSQAASDQNKSSNGGVNQMGGNAQQQPNFMNFLMSQLTPEQRKTFEMFNMMMNSMPSDMGSMSGQNIKSQDLKEEDNVMKAQDLSENDMQDDVDQS
ncbi:MAG: hypothetical protein Q4G58_08175 [bacterium]|nr:hypothetical protein [bacterium]